MDTSALPRTGTCHLTTTGRRSGRAVRIEIWFVVVDGRFLVTGLPGPRDWLANLRADPRAVLEVGGPPRSVVAHEVTAEDDRRALVPGIWAAQPWYGRRGGTQEDWVAGAPIVELVEAPPEDDASARAADGAAS